MDELTQANASTAEEVASASEELNRQSTELDRVVYNLAQLAGSLNTNNSLINAVNNQSELENQNHGLVEDKSSSNSAVSDDLLTLDSSDKGGLAA